MVATVAACGGGGGGDGGNGGAVVIQSLSISPESVSFAVGETRQLRAEAKYTDGSTKVVTTGTSTQTTTWNSSNDSVVTVNQTGLATAKGTGTANITALFDGLTATAQITVTAAKVAEIQITPSTPKVNKGLTLQLTATAVFTDSSIEDVTGTANWVSLNQTVLTVGNATGSRGLVTGVNNGSATVTASFGGKTGARTVVVGPGVLSEIKVTPTGATIPKGGFTQPYTATGLFDDGSSSDLTTQVTWVSSDTAKATISNVAGSKGVATSIATGATNITASLSGKTSTAVALNVSDESLTALTITPAPVAPATAVELPIGQSARFSVTGTFQGPTPTGGAAPAPVDRDVTEQAVWASEDNLVATVSNVAGKRGLVVPQKAGGPIEISAKVGPMTETVDLTITAKALTQLQIDPPTLKLPKTLTRQLTATGIFSDATTGNQTTQVAWTSDAPTIAAVSNAAGSQGELTALRPGTANITAQRVDPVSNETVSTTIEVTVTDVVLKQIKLTPSTSTIAQSTTQAFKATGVFTDNTELDITEQDGLVFESSDDNIASFAAVGLDTGEALAKAQGTVTVTASKKATPDAATEIEGTASLSVTTASIEEVSVRNVGADCAAATPVTDVDTSLPLGFKVNFIACARFSDGSTKNVTSEASWTSQANAVMGVSNDAGSKGLATGNTAGRTVVEATLGAKKDSAPVVVTTATLASIAVTAAAETITADGTPRASDGALLGDESLQYSAVGTFSDATTLPITKQVVWSSSASSVTVSNAAGTEGKASANGPVFFRADVTITATKNGKKGEATVSRRQ